MRRPSVSFVIPMFNEEENIEHAIDAAVDALTRSSSSTTRRPIRRPRSSRALPRTTRASG
jgi:hypothetical protein